MKFKDLFMKLFRPNFISNNGYAVEILDKNTIRYFENKKTITIDVELLAEKYTFLIDKNNINCWDEPRNKELISEPERIIILDNISKVFIKRDILVKVV